MDAEMKGVKVMGQMLCMLFLYASIILMTLASFVDFETENHKDKTIHFYGISSLACAVITIILGVIYFPGFFEILMK